MRLPLLLRNLLRPRLVEESVATAGCRKCGHDVAHRAGSTKMTPPWGFGIWCDGCGGWCIEPEVV